jgi:hypothetical protein
MKHPIKWHRECLHNQKESLKDELRRLEIQEERVNRLRSDTILYENQIERAIRMKKDGFDSDKFGKKVPLLNGGKE